MRRHVSLRKQHSSTPVTPESPVLITGGAGFIGTNLADRLLTMGCRVVILDNLSRAGVDQNVLWLQRRHGPRLKIVIGDVRDRDDVRRALEGCETVFHFAAQVAVTTSILDPWTDFDINAAGTVNLLDQARRLPVPPRVIFTSTNKVYGGLQDIPLTTHGKRYVPADRDIAAHGISEQRPLDFHTPYGCSKGAAEQYVLDHARTLGLDTVVFRMSCIYGPHQFGTEDQGWVAHFLIRALEEQPLVLYGDGLQVRDILYVDDLVDAFMLVMKKPRDFSGQAFNIGGGAERTVSLLELLDLIAAIRESRPMLRFERSRAGDQRYYVSDISKFRTASGWQPQVSPGEGVRRLYEWLLESRRFVAQETVAS